MGSCGSKGSKRSPDQLKLSIAPYKNSTNYIIKIIQPSLFYNLVVKDLNRELSSQPRDNEYIDIRDNHKFSERHLKNSLNIDFDNLRTNPFRL